MISTGVIVCVFRTLKPTPGVSSGEAVGSYSEHFASHMTPARVGDEVTYTLVEQSGRAVLEDCEVSLFYEIAERIFVLSNYL